MLQESLGGNAKTSLIITCSPSYFNEAETVSTLRFGARAKKVKNKPKINKDVTVQELKMQLDRAEAEIEEKNNYIAKLERIIKELGAKLPKDGAALPDEGKEVVVNNSPVKILPSESIQEENEASSGESSSGEEPSESIKPSQEVESNEVK